MPSFSRPTISSNLELVAVAISRLTMAVISTAPAKRKPPEMVAVDEAIREFEAESPSPDPIPSHLVAREYDTQGHEIRGRPRGDY